MENFQERFSKFEIIENLYCFYKKTIKWFCEKIFNEKFEMIFCKGKGGKWEAAEDESMK